jgi:hypothetical protein
VGDPDLKLLIGILVLVGLPVAGWYFRDALLPQESEPAVVEPLPLPAEGPAKIGPIHPLTPIEPVRGADGRLIELPPLDDSDAYFLLALGDLFGSEVESLLAKEGLIDRFVATVDNLPRSAVSEKIRVAGRLADTFRAETTGNENAFYASPENYRRYDQLVGLAASANIDAVVDTYQRFYPLLQQSYQQLGYPNGYFNDRVVEVIDHLLETPELDEPALLVRPNVLYEYADPELERLSAGQKLLLRVGPEHAAVLKGLLRKLRDELTRSPDGRSAKSV